MKTLYPIATILALAACGGVEPGGLSIAVYGEDFIEEGIPADELIDDWSIEFDRFLVSIGDITAADGESDVALASAPFVIVDLARPTNGDGTELISGEVDGGLYDRVGYRVAPSASATANNASQDDVALMTSTGSAVYVEGTASRGGVTKTFAWSFTTGTRYGDCEGTAEIDGAPATLELTIHGDHLFYDDLISPEPNVAFDLIAAADDSGDGDGVVTSAELAATSIASEERYQVGNFGVDNLWDFIDRQVSTLGHIDGEGHCAIAERE